MGDVGENAAATAGEEEEELGSGQWTTVKSRRNSSKGSNDQTGGWFSGDAHTKRRHHSGSSTSSTQPLIKRLETSFSPLPSPQHQHLWSKSPQLSPSSSISGQQARVEFQRILSSGVTDKEGILTSDKITSDPLRIMDGLRGIKANWVMYEEERLTVAKLTAGYDAKKKQAHAEKNYAKGHNVYQLLLHGQILESALTANSSISVASRDCLMALQNLNWDEKVKISSYRFHEKSIIVTFLKRGFPDGTLNDKMIEKRETTESEYRGYRYQEKNYVVTDSNASSQDVAGDFLTLNEVILHGWHNGEEKEITMLVCTEIDGKLGGEMWEIKYSDKKIGREFDKKANWCLFCKLAGVTKLRVGEKLENGNIFSHDFLADELLDEPKTRAKYNRKVNLLFDNVWSVIEQGKTGQVRILDLAAINLEYYQQHCKVNDVKRLRRDNPLVPDKLIKRLRAFVATRETIE